MVNHYPTCLDYFKAVREVTSHFDINSLNRIRKVVHRAYSNNQTIFVAGNGGNATVADHFALGMSLNILRETGRQGRAMSLSSGALLTAAVNDFGANRMFAVQLQSMGRPGDLFVALSASGCSENLAEAVDQCLDMDMKSVAIVGKPGPVSNHADEILVIGTDSAAISEDVTMMALHWLYGTFMQNVSVRND